MTMKVKRLIEQLKEIPEDTEVWLSSDAEGNNFNSLSESDLYKVWFMDDYEFEFTVEDELNSYPEDGLKDIVVLWP